MFLIETYPSVKMRMKLYIDNTLSTSRTYSITANRIGDYQFIIGGEPGRNNMSIVGELCAIRIYSKVLTEDEMNTNYAIDKVRFNLPNITGPEIS